MEPEVIYEDADVVLINKPVGLLVHADGHSEGETVVGWFLGQYPDSQGVGEPAQAQDGSELERSGVVHRLDRETSGIMILAKTQSAYEHLKRQFHDRAVQKEYRALVYGPVRERWGTIDKPIGRSPRDPRRRLAGNGAKGQLRDATTDWECIGSGMYQEEIFSYLKLKPQTGRTHQLRVHLKSISRPIVGDTLYAESEMRRSNNLELDRLALHAHKLKLLLPNGEEGNFIAPVPASIEQAVERIANE